ncbi:unnamed protein product [Cuscuta campestris]|uniref:Secreted protein n=1 Tax=Cuscuta campestris TaxID=132261 RepID=A0A484N8Z7_9ASTE|nr:unnamed protein product [Cuscuta campestris]
MNFLAPPCPLFVLLLCSCRLSSRRSSLVLPRCCVLMPELLQVRLSSFELEIGLEVFPRLWKFVDDGRYLKGLTNAYFLFIAFIEDCHKLLTLGDNRFAVNHLIVQQTENCWCRNSPPLKLTIAIDVS